MDTKLKGNITELKIATKLVEMGCTVSFPFGENARYDMIADWEGTLYRIQCKTGRYLPEKGKIIISTQSTKCYRNHNEDINKRSSYIGEIEYIGSYCPQLDKCYLIPIKDCPKGALSLRIDTPRNMQIDNIIWAEKYEI